MYIYPLSGNVMAVLSTFLLRLLHDFQLRRIASVYVYNNADPDFFLMQVLIQTEKWEPGPCRETFSKVFNNFFFVNFTFFLILNIKKRITKKMR